MKRTFILPILVLSLIACTSHSPGIARVCDGISDLDIPHSALIGQWQETEVVEMRANSATPYWVKRNHVLTREGQLTTREEICADEACLQPKAELTHFGSFEFDAEKGLIEKSYRKHFYTAIDDSWMRSWFPMEKCHQGMVHGAVVPVDQPECLDVLGVKSGESWKLQGATLRSLALRNCGPQLRASAQLTRELVRMF